jgi:hypothetical protein
MVSTVQFGINLVCKLLIAREMCNINCEQIIIFTLVIFNTPVCQRADIVSTSSSITNNKNKHGAKDAYALLPFRMPHSLTSYSALIAS